MTKREFERLTPELVKHVSTAKEYVSTFKIVTPDNKTITKIKKTKIIASQSDEIIRLKKA